MAMNKTTYLRNKLLDHTLRNTSYTPPTTVYLGLFTAAPGIGGGGTEVSGGAYARKAITFGAASGGDVSNTAAVNFDQATADWGACGWGAIFDAATSGNQLYNGALTVSKTVQNGDTIGFAIGEIDVSER